MSEPETAPPPEETRMYKVHLASPAVGLFHSRPLQLLVATGDEGVVIELSAEDAARLVVSVGSALPQPPRQPEDEALARAQVAGNA